MIKKLGLKLKEQKGFTLIELLAVIVILGIIAAIAIPAIGNVIQKSKDNAKVAEALQIIDAARLSQADGATTGTTTNGVTTWASTATNATPPVVTSALSKYISKVKDNVWTVTYTQSTNTFTITGHDAAQVVDTTIANNAVAASTVTEEALAAKASN